MGGSGTAHMDGIPRLQLWCVRAHMAGRGGAVGGFCCPVRAVKSQAERAGAVRLVWALCRLTRCLMTRRTLRWQKLLCHGPFPPTRFMLFDHRLLCRCVSTLCYASGDKSGLFPYSGIKKGKLPSLRPFRVSYWYIFLVQTN